MNGIVVLNKPEGLSSAAVVARVKRILKAAKVGHTGTLDPFARGVLVCCVNQATRLTRFLMAGRKTYEAVLTLGIDTDTQDATGKITAQRDCAGLSKAAILGMFKRYEGAVHQTPPAYSALKHEGVPLYALARRGRPVQKPPRPVHIFSNRVLEVAGSQVRFQVCCSAGTYVRALGADIGRALGCGGHLSALTRLESGGFTLDQAITLEELDELARRDDVGKTFTGMAGALKGMAEITAGPALVENIRHGRSLDRHELEASGLACGAALEETFIKVLDDHGELAAVLRRPADTERLEYACVFARPER